MLDHLLKDLEKAVHAGAWYSATSLALSLPDICAAIDSPSAEVGERYRKWAQSYFVPLMRAGGHMYFSDKELYRLRCKFLYEGQLPNLEEPGSETPSTSPRIQLVTTPPEVGGRSSFSTDGRVDAYVVSVEELCNGMAESVQAWCEVANRDAARAAKLGELLRLHP